MENASQPRTMSYIAELTQAAIKHETETLANLGLLGKTKMTDAIREQLEVWESTLFPLLRSQKINRHQYIADLLEKAGYEKVTAAHICTVIYRIKKNAAKKSDVKPI